MIRYYLLYETDFLLHRANAKRVARKLEEVSYF